LTYSNLTRKQRKILEKEDKKPFPNNELLFLLFNEVDKVVIKSSGVYDNKALSNEVLLTLTGCENINNLVHYLQVEQPSEVNYCMCLGSHAIELYTNGLLKATIGLHHGTSIRYEEWKGDADLIDSNGLLTWLSSVGCSEPLNDFFKDQQTKEKTEDSN
jgi:hypothetical protein